VDLAPGCIGLSLDNRGGDSKWDKVVLLFNTGATAQQVNIPDGTWQVLCDERTSFRWKQACFLTGQTTLPPVSAAILGRIPNP